MAVIFDKILGKLRDDDDIATLKDEVDRKQDLLVSGQNVKTVNGQSILGAGNLEVGGHFKGWFDTLEDLQTSHPSPQVGDYAYVKGTTSTDPAAIYECTTAGSWSDSGRTTDTSNVQTFADGIQVNEVSIQNITSVFLDTPLYDSKVEFLQSQNIDDYIDTGITPNQNTRIIVDVEVNSICGFIAGSRIANKDTQIGLNVSSENTLRYDYGSYPTSSSPEDKYTTPANPLYWNNRVVMDLNKGVCVLNGNILYTFSSRTFSNNYSIYLFSTNNGGTYVNAVNVGLKIFSAKIYSNDVLVRDFIPVRVGVVGYMFDKVSGQLFGNQGTGNFILGNDVPTQIDIENDSIQEIFVNQGSTRVYPKTIVKAVFGGTIGKKWVGFGDSLTYQDSSRYSGLSWSPIVCEKTGLEFYNCGVGSTAIAGNGENAFWTSGRINAVEGYNPDIITIQGGANDLVQNILIGDESEFTKTLQNKDKNTFLGAYSYIIETLLTWKPLVNIVIIGMPYFKTNGTEYTQITTGLTCKDFADACEQVAKYYGLSYVDLYHEMGMNVLTQSYLASDKLHWNAYGSERVASLIISKIISINVGK